MTDALVRPYSPTDRDALYDVCLRTADSGRDATAMYQQNPDLVGDVYAGPYAFLEPDCTFVLDNGERAVGYVLGTPDTTRYVKEFRDRWLPLVGPKHPVPDHAPATEPEHAAWLLHHPEAMVRPELAGYPAHLHIDLLPDYQRRGHGRRLMYTILDTFRKAGAAAVHLSVSPANAQARAFYDRLGFHPLDGGTRFGRSTTV